MADSIFTNISPSKQGAENTQPRKVGPRNHSVDVPSERKPRKINRIIAFPNEIREATRLFAAGKITREELAYRLRAT